MRVVVYPSKYYRSAVVGAFILFSSLAYQAFSIPLQPWLKIVSVILFFISVGGLVDEFISKIVSLGDAFQIVALLYSITIPYDEIEDVIIEESVLFIKKRDGGFQKFPGWVAATQRNKHILLNELKARKRTE